MINSKQLIYTKNLCLLMSTIERFFLAFQRKDICSIRTLKFEMIQVIKAAKKLNKMIKPLKNYEKTNENKI